MVVVVTGDVRLVVGVPPVGVVYQLIVLPFTPGVAVMVAEPQAEAGDAVAEPGMEMMVNVTATRAAVLSHPVVVL